MDEPTDAWRRDGRGDDTEQPVPVEPGQEVFRLARLRDEMVTPWQLPPITARFDSGGIPARLGQPVPVDTDYVVAWQLMDARS